jgi:signal transduction histidine kinase
MAVAFGAAFVVATGVRAMLGLGRARRQMSLPFVLALPVMSASCAALYALWLYAEAAGAGELRGSVAALLMGLGGPSLFTAAHVTGRLLAQREADRADIALRLDARTAELRSALARVERDHDQVLALIEVAEVMPFEVDITQGCISWSNPAADTKVLGQVLMGMPVGDFLAGLVVEGDRAALRARALELVSKGGGQLAKHEFRIRTGDGRNRTLRVAAHVAHVEGRPAFVRGYVFDVTELRQLEADLAQAQKLEAVGRLAAGIAHEINTPVQFVGDSVQFVHTAMDGMVRAIHAYRALATRARQDGVMPEELGAVEQAEEDADLDYSLEHVPKAIERARTGLGRVASIVRSLKIFAHPDSTEMTCVNLNEAVESTLTVARNEYKYVADLETDFGEIPPVTCFPGEINQALLNIVVNAAHAIEDVVKSSGGRGRITVRTRAANGRAVVTVSDTGGGIPENIRHRIFDPFFTTKEVGRGTGQGLAIARKVIVDKHHGELSFDSEVGRGTTFRIAIPIDGPGPGNGKGGQPGGDPRESDLPTPG